MTFFTAKEMQLALYDRLTNAPQLTGRLTGLYDEVPHDAVMPYLSMGETRVSDASVKGRKGYQLQFELTLFSRDNSQLEVKELMAVVDATLADAPLAVRGHDLVTLRLESAISLRRFREDGSVYEGRLRYTAVLFSAEHSQ